MDMVLLFVVLFLGISFISWTVISIVLHGYERYERSYTEKAGTTLEALFLFFDAKKIFVINLLALLVLPVLIYLITQSLFYVVLAAVVIFVLPKLVLKYLEKRRREAINQALPDALAQIAGSMRSGSTMLTAIQTMVEETKGPLSQEFALLVREQRLGTTMEEALDNLAERVQTAEMDLVVTAAQIAREVGGNLSEIFDRLSTTLRSKMDMEGKIKALTSQGKLQGWVVGLLPFGIILALMYVEPKGIGPIFTSILGWGFLAVIIVLEIMGGIMIRKIVSIDV